MKKWELEAWSQSQDVTCIRQWPSVGVELIEGLGKHRICYALVNISELILPHEQCVRVWLKTIYDLVYDNHQEKIRACFGKAGVYLPLVKVMTDPSYQENKHMQLAAIKALGTLTARKPHGERTSLPFEEYLDKYMVAVDHLLWAMKKWPNNAAIQCWGCQVILNLAWLPENRIVLGAKGACDVVLSALTVKPDDNLVKWAMAACHELLVESTENTSRLVEGKICSILPNILQRQRPGTALDSSLFVIYHLARLSGALGEECRSQLVSADANERILACISYSNVSYGVAMRGIATINALLDVKESKAKLSTAKTLNVICKIMNRCPVDKPEFLGICEEGCAAMIALVGDHKDANPAERGEWRKAVVRVLQEETAGKNIGLMEFALEALGKFWTLEDTKAWGDDESVLPELIVNRMRQPAAENVARIQVSICGKRWMMKDHVGSPDKVDGITIKNRVLHAYF